MGTKLSATLLMLLPLAALAQTPTSDCPGPLRFKNETKTCRYDIAYPVLTNPQAECIVRKWIDKTMGNFTNDEPALVPSMFRKNEFDITCEVFNSGHTQSVLITNYVYDQGPDAIYAIKTFTFDVNTGQEYQLLDVLNDDTNWYPVVLPFFKQAGAERHDVFIAKADVESGTINDFVVDRGTLMVCFAPCEMAPCDYKTIKVKIPLVKIKDFLKPEFLQAVPVN